MVNKNFDIQKLRSDFPILLQKVNGNQLAYFDNAASSQKPWLVINAINKYYSEENSNVHRGVHHLSARATEKFEGVREKVRAFLNARHAHEIIFTRGTTDSINLVAFSFGKKFIGKNDEVLISAMEHHSNIVPWQLICDEKGAKLRVIPINDHGEIIFDEYEKLLNEKTKIVAVTHISNTLGTINPVKKIIETAHKKNIPVLIDGAQSVAHFQIDIRDLDADFYVFSSHKMYGPTGIGILFGKEKFLNEMPPYQGGGEMIKTVSFEKTTYNDLPHKFEAGTPHISGVIGLGAAIDFLNNTGLENMMVRENELFKYATEKLSQIDGLKIYGTAREKASVISFLLDGVHPYDVGVILDQMGIAVRTGHHCTQPLMERFNIRGTVRPSFAFFNTIEEIDRLEKAVLKAKKLLSK